MTRDGRVCVGQIVGAHGVRGLVRLKSFTEDPAAVATYGPVEDEAGQRRWRLRLQSRAGECWLAQIEGIADRSAAEALRGCRLYVDRSQLPEPDEEEFYHADLIGMSAEQAGDRQVLGVVTAVGDFGGGIFLELRLVGEERNVGVPFTRAVVPEVDVKGRRLVIDPPAGLFDRPEPPGGDDEAEGAEVTGAEVMGAGVLGERVSREESEG
jgi:16S rRNA processing protein RimM